MTLFTVDGDKCNSDGLCVAACPMGIIEIKDEGTAPEPTPDADEMCINCGHCVAVCPTGAVSIGAMSPEQCTPIRKELLVGPEQIEQHLLSRRSIRAYQNQNVDRDVIGKLINIARYGPSGHNEQPIRWMVIYDSAEVRRFAGMVIDWMKDLIQKDDPVAETLHMDRSVAQWDAGVERICRGAPHMIVTHAPAEERTAPIAAATTLTYLELAAPTLNLGTCWAGYFARAANDWPPMKEALGLPEGDVCFGAMMLGYPKFKYQRIPLRNQQEITWR
jgi:nitroreductase/NAD-dependent dihydropyrimidine dehydrogenase PreA subunit